MYRLPILAFLALGACGSGKTDDSNGTTTPTGSTAGATPAGTTSGTAGGTTSTECNPLVAPDPVGDPLTVRLDGECPLDNKWGEVVVSIFEEGGFSTVAGEVRSGVVPITVLEDVTDPKYTGGQCKMLRRNNPFCNPACNPDETCDFDGQCLPYPENQDVGVVTVGGVYENVEGSATHGVVMHPLQPGNNYFNVNMWHPAFNPGELIETRTGCGVYDPIDLHGVGVEALNLVDPNWTVFEGQDLPFTWDPPTVALNPGQHVHVRLNIDQHGNTPVQMYCEFPDTGSAALPGVLIDQLMNFGVTGFPNATVTRRTVDQAILSSGGCVDMIVSSPADPNVLVDGFIPCIPGGTSTCPTGMTCNNITGICE